MSLKTINKKAILNAPKYQVGDIIQVISTGAFWLIEDIDHFEYCVRILDTDNTRRDSIFYIDIHTNIIKVA